MLFESEAGKSGSAGSPDLFTPHHLGGLDSVEAVEPKLASRTTIYPFGEGVASFVIVEEHDEAKQPDVTQFRPELSTAFGARNQHRTMLSHWGSSIYDEYGATSCTLRATSYSAAFFAVCVVLRKR